MPESRSSNISRLLDRFHFNNTQNNGSDRVLSHGSEGSSSGSPSIELNPASHTSRSSISTAWDRSSTSAKGKRSANASVKKIPHFLAPGGRIDSTASTLSPPYDERPSSFSKGAPIDRLGPFGFIETVPGDKVSNGKLPAYPKGMLAHTEPRVKHQKVRKQKKWYTSWSTRKIILTVIAGILFIALTIGLSVGLTVGGSKAALTPTWRPAMESTWQIQLNGTVNNPSLRAAVYEIDMFGTSDAQIENMNNVGRRVVCYFSGGTWESSRSDASQFPKAALGNYLSGSTTERYVDTRNKNVQKIMKARMKMSAKKGCNGMDIGHIDSYKSETGFPLTSSTAIKYLTSLAHDSHSIDLAIGFRNSHELVNTTADLADFQVNENCVLYEECDFYQPFITAGKSVFHIEYMAVGNETSSFLNWACNANGTRGFSTLVKRVDLGSWALDCPFALPGYGAY